MAPTPGDFEQQTQLEEARRREEEQRRQIDAPGVKLQEEQKISKKVELPVEEVSFQVERIIVESTMPSKFSFAQRLVEQYENRKIGIQGINLLAQMLSENIMARGYVTTSVTIPEQDLTSGTLRFTIIPGKISNIRFEDPSMYGTWRNAFPTRAGKILNIRSLEQGLEQMKRVPNQDVTMELLPGQSQGESEVLIKVARTKPWTIGFSFDDSGMKDTGRLQSSANISIYNPTGLNDIISYSYGKDAEGNDSKFGTRNFNISYSIPFGNYTFSFLRYRYRYLQTISGYNDFESKSRTDAVELNLQKVIYRDQTKKTQAYFKLTKKERRNYLEDVEIEVQRQQTTSYQIGFMHRQYMGRNILDASVYFQKGVPWWGAQPGYGDNIPDMGTTRYSLWGLNLNIMVPLKLGPVDARYSFTFRGQYTKDILYSSDHFSIGGRWTVRGFNGEYTLSAENGYIIRNELAFPLKKMNMEFFLGADMGRVWGPSDFYLTGKNLAGTVFGVRGTLLKHMQYEGFIGTPIYKPEGFKAGKTALGFSLYLQF